MIKQLNTEERFSYHQIYRKDSLFRHWLTILSQNKEHIQSDPVSIWHSSEKVIEQLRKTQEERPEMVEFLIDEMLSCNDTNKVVAIMCIVVSRLANATEIGKEDESHPNDPICIAIYRYFCENELFLGLLEKMTHKTTDNYGQKVILTPDDPLAQNPVIENLIPELRSKMEKMYEQVLLNTNSLSQHMKQDIWQRWKTLWQNICFDQDFFELLNKVSPNKNDWNFNQKLVCNVLGIFNSELGLNISVQNLNNCLSKKNLSSYIRNYSPKSGSDTELNAEKLKLIQDLILRTS